MPGDKLKKEIIINLLYAEVFSHPLKKEEIENYSPHKTTSKDLEQAFDELVNGNVIKSKDDYYYVFEEGEKINKRLKGNDSADKMMPKAKKIARFIHKFPFVEGVGISGSLSKGVLHDDADFDFFIITKPNRLWVARTLLILYKKVFLLNSRKFFCVNYFIDTDNLEIEEKNRFTAMEIATLIPASGEIMQLFYSENEWIESYLCHQYDGEENITSLRKPILSKLITGSLKGKFGEWMDDKFMRMTFNRWQKKFGTFDSKKFDLTMKTRKYVSKHHPSDFQNKILVKHEELITAFKKEHIDELEKQNVSL